MSSSPTRSQAASACTAFAPLDPDRAAAFEDEPSGRLILCGVFAGNRGHEIREVQHQAADVFDLKRWFVWIGGWILATLGPRVTSEDCFAPGRSTLGFRGRPIQRCALSGPSAIFRPYVEPSQ